jgi:hypothetical protein
MAGGFSEMTPETYRPRIQAFRDELIKMLPRAPNDKASRGSLEAMPMHRLILAFVNWRMRLIPAKPRMVQFWSGGITPLQAQLARSKLQPLLRAAATGKVLTPYLSDSVNRIGIDLNETSPRSKRRDMDMVLTRHGLHHFHVGVRGAANPKGRSEALVFAEVLEKEFRVVALSDHRAFEQGSPEQLRFFNVCHAYMAKDIPAGQGFMMNPVMTSGHSLVVTMFSNQCEAEMDRTDLLLDDPEFIDKLYNDQPIIRAGKPVHKPGKPQFAWHFNDLEFGILDKTSMVFFCKFPFFAR